MRILENRCNWYKGNMHMHTTVSDGVLDPVDVIDGIMDALRKEISTHAWD